MGESLAPYLPQITTLMLLSLRSSEGIVVSRGWPLAGPCSEGIPVLRLIPWAQLSQGSCCASFIQPQYDGSSSFLLFDDESDGEEEEELMDEDAEEEDDSEISGYGRMLRDFQALTEASAALL